jgi:hypothetical protein
MMSSQAMSYPSPGDGHTPHTMGSPVPSQLLLHRVASPNHLVGQRLYGESPRSVPADYPQHYPSSQEQQQFEYEQAQELYINDDHIYDFGPNGALPVEPQFVQPQPPPSEQALMYNVSHLVANLTNSLPAYKSNHPLPCTIT